MDDNPQTKAAPVTTQQLPRKKRFSVVGAVVTVLSLGTAGSTSYYSWDLYNQNKGLEGEKTQLSDQLSDQQKEIADLRVTADDLDNKLAGCQDQIDIQATALGTKTKELETTTVALNVCQASVSDLQAQKAKAEAEVKELDAFTEKFKKLIDTGKLVVEFRRGQMIVELPSSILFASGSAELSPEGELAISEVAAVLKTVPKRRFIVAGHTDNLQPSKDDIFKTNWALSTARALTVTEVLIKKGMKPSRLVAAGYAEYAPIAKNTTPAGRQKNRRIEIIVEPDLSNLEELAEKEEPPKEKK